MSFASSVGSLGSSKKSMKTPDTRKTSLSSESAHKTPEARASPTTDENASYLANAQQSRLTYQKSTPSTSLRGRSPSGNAQTPPLHPSRSSFEKETTRSKSGSRGRSPHTESKRSSTGSRLSSRSPSTSRRSFDSESIYDSWSFSQKRAAMKEIEHSKQPLEYTVGLVIRGMNADEISSNSKRIISTSTGHSGESESSSGNENVSIIKPHLFEEANSPGAVAAAASLYNNPEWANSFTFDKVFNLMSVSNVDVHGERDSHLVEARDLPHFMQTTNAAEQSSVSEMEKKKVHSMLLKEHQKRVAKHDGLTMAAQRHQQDLEEQVRPSFSISFSLSLYIYS